MSSNPKPPPCLAFTTKYSGRTNVLFTDLEVLVPDGFPDAGKSIKVRAIWDTGATGSVITERVAKHLSLAVLSRVPVAHAGGKSIVDSYLVDFVLPNHLRIPRLSVTAMDVTGADALIGMDVISRGDLAVTINKGKTVMSFHFPPRNKPIDFVPMSEQEMKRRAKFGANPSARSLRNKARKSR